MKARTNIMLLAVLLALCIGYWYMVRSGEQRKAAVIEARKLFAFAPTDITTITIQREAERASTGVRTDSGTWRVTDPIEAPANSLIWERVAKNIAELSNQRTIEEKPKDVSVYKLDEPRLMVAAQTKDGNSINVQFGEMDPTQKFRYAQLDGGAVFLAGPDQFFELDRDLTWLRDVELFDESDAGITYIEFTPMRVKPGTESSDDPEVQKATSVIAEKDASGTWSIVAPTPGTADQVMLNQLATDLQYARGRGYVDSPENLKDYKLDPAVARLRVRSGPGGEMQTAFFGGFEPSSKENPGVYAMQEGRPSVFVVDAHVVNGFPQAGPDAWREKRLVTKQGSDITSIKYQAGPQQFLLAKDDQGGWKIKEPQEEATDQAAVSRFIGELIELKGSSTYVERKPEFGFDVPAIRIALTYKDVEAPAEVLVGATTPNSDRRYVTQDSGVVTTLDTFQLEKLAISPKDFMARGLMSFKKNAVREMKLTLEETSYAFVRGEQAWKIQEPAGKVWESQDDMQGLIDVFANFSAESVDTADAPEDLSLFGLDKPTLSVSVSVLEDGAGGPAVLGPLTIGKLCPDDDHVRYAMIAGRTQVYRVKQLPVSAVRSALRGVVDQ